MTVGSVLHDQCTVIQCSYTVQYTVQFSIQFSILEHDADADVDADAATVDLHASRCDADADTVLLYYCVNSNFTTVGDPSLLLTQ